MKFLIATSAFALSLAAPAFADVTEAEKHFAQSNSSAAETILWDTSTGNPIEAAERFALTNDSPAETTVNFERARSVDLRAVRAMFAMSNESPAETVVN